MNIFRLMILGGLAIILTAVPSFAELHILAQTQGAKIPQATVGPDGKVYLVYGTTTASIYWCVSENGTDFSPPQKVADPDGLVLGFCRGPRIVVTRSAMVVASVDKNGNLISWRSEDRGEHWTSAATINDVHASAREGLCKIATGPDDRLFAVWMDSRKDGGRIYGASSTDSGKTWSANVLIYESPDGRVSDCCTPSAIFDAQGNIHVMFRNWLAGAQDMYLTSSTDGGKTF